MPMVKVSNGGTWTEYRLLPLNNGASSDSLTIKRGDVIALSMLEGKWAYKKNGGAQQSYTVPYATYMTTYGDFMYLVGHNYGCSFRCLADGEYILVNNSGHNRNYAVPDR